MPARRVTYDPNWDATVERLTGIAVDPSVSVGGVQPRKGQFMHPRLRRTIEKMAKRLGITVKRQWTDYELWGAIYERTKGGVQRPTDVLPGDPFCLFLTGYCSEGHAPYETTITAKKDGGVPIEEDEGKAKIEEMKAAFPACDATLASGEPCGKAFTQWSADMTRMSTFAETDRARRLARVK